MWVWLRQGWHIWLLATKSFETILSIPENTTFFSQIKLLQGMQQKARAKVNKNKNKTMRNSAHWMQRNNRQSAYSLLVDTHIVRAPVFGILNSAISNFQTWFDRTVMEVLKYCWMKETSNMQCNYNSFIQIINFHGLFRNALRCR